MCFLKFSMLDWTIVQTRENIKRTILDKKGVLISEIITPLCLLDKKAYLNSYEDNCFFMINSNNQEPIHHIHCFWCIFYHQSKTNKFCWFNKFLFYDLYVESYSSNVCNIFLLNKTSLYSLQQHFYSHLLLSMFIVVY